jgi:hypothetical protein
MNSEKYQFNKIAKFITDSYNDMSKRGNIIVKSVGNTFVVNDIKIKNSNGIWNVERGKATISTFKQRRIAILFAALVCKKRYTDSHKMVAYDHQMDMLLDDKERFKRRLKTKYNPILDDRLENVETNLDLLEQQLRELEKSLSLQ